MNNKLIHIFNSLLCLLCLIALFGGLVYRAYSLNGLGVAISLALALVSFVIIQYFYLISNKKTRFRVKEAVNENGYSPAPAYLKIFAAVGYFLLLVFGFYVLYAHSSSGALVSPWQAIPAYFFIIYGLATLFLIINAILNKKLALFFIILHYFLSFSVALIIYRLGYGYDSFIHQTTENLIDKTGAVDPKPFYYLGQYALVVILHKITTIPVVWLDKLLVPLLAALFLPIAAWRVLKAWFNSESLNLILILAVLGLSFPFLIVTTPQNMAYLLMLLAIILGLACKNIYDFLIIILLSLTAAITQPVAGIPAVLFTAFLAAYHSDRAKLKKYAYPILTAITAFILPVSFFLLNRRLSPSAAAAAARELDLTGLAIPGRENIFLNFAYLYGFNLKFILAAFALAGIFIAYKHREQCKILFIYFTISASLFISYLIAAKIPFAYLINYERNDYPQRILFAAGLFLIPFIALSVYALMEKIAKQNIFIKSSFAIFLALIIGASLYVSYPRYDNYFNSRGYSVSAADIEAVNWINENGGGDFIVLANQQVSAAALSRFGFKKYYDSGRLFYYPIPTGAMLYQYYLDMVYKKPSRETMIAAMDLAGVKEGYFVLNKYWLAFPKILDEAKFRADSWREFGDGQVYAFKYEKK